MTKSSASDFSDLLIRGDGTGHYSVRLGKFHTFVCGYLGGCFARNGQSDGLGQVDPIHA